MNKVDTRECVKTVTSNSFITSSNLGKLSLKARKLLYIAIAQCKKNDTNFYEYEISVQNFAEILDIKPQSIYQEIDKVTDELMRGLLIVKMKDNKSFKKYSLFSKCEYNHSAGLIYFKLNEDMSIFLLNLKSDFTQPLLQDFMKMKSVYSISIWHLMQREMHSAKPGVTNIIEFELSLKELRQVTETQNKLKQLSEFKTRVFDKALKEIKNHCLIDITYENVKKGRKVVAFRCKAKSKYYYDINVASKEHKNKLRYIELKMRQELTEQERQEYESLSAKIAEMKLDF